MGIKIEFARGDSYERGFYLKNKGESGAVIETWDDIYFTVKKYHTDEDFILQNRLSTGGIRDDGDGHYTLMIEPEDTDGLAFGDYDCDIEFKKGDTKKTFYGKFILDKEVTHVNNE